MQRPLNFVNPPISNSTSVNLTYWGLDMRILPSVTLAASLAAAALAMAASFSAPAMADGTDPSPHLIYQAAAAGHFDQAQQMMDQVLKDHPKSGKAHYIQAELYAKEGKTALARSELAQAEDYDPGLTKEDARSVHELKSQLGLIRGNPALAPNTMGGGLTAPQSSIHWGLVFIVILAVLALWMLFRRRNTSQQYGAPAMGATGTTFGGPPGYGGPAGYGGAPMGGGIGSGIGGSIASGLAVGAGVVAGEELAHHFLDGDRHEGTVAPSNDNGNNWQQSSNSDMGGTDFGVNDSNSWDDSSGGGTSGGGGDSGGGDWS